MCQQLANASPLTQGGTYKAWISGTAIDSSPARRFTNLRRTGPYLRVDGVEVAASWADLTRDVPEGDPILRALIDVNEMGGAAPSIHAWTHTSWTGFPFNGPDSMVRFCDGWTTSNGAVYGRYGGTYLDERRWTSLGATFCDNQFALYCFEQG